MKSIAEMTKEEMAELLQQYVSIWISSARKAAYNQIFISKDTGEIGVDLEVAASNELAKET